MSKILSLVSAVAMLAVSASAFADAPNSTSQPTSANTSKPANACAKINKSWDVNANVSYLYWYANQDGMDVATTSNAIDQEVISQKGQYNSAFQVGLGVELGTGKQANKDNEGWAINSEYTRYHHSHKQEFGVNANGATYTDTWGNEITKAKTLSTNWKLHLDQLDLVIGRPICKSNSISVFPTVGLRALWIKQNQTIAATGLPPSSIVDFKAASSDSWALGAVGNVNTRVAIWNGLRIDGVVGSSLLYTNYKKITASKNGVETAVNKNISALRPTLDVGLGLGYGQFFSDNKYYVDLSARYDFNLFWSQNVMHNYAKLVNGAQGSSLGDLVLHGLTINARFDF